MSNEEDNKVTAPKRSMRILVKILIFLIVIGMMGYVAYNRWIDPMLETSTHEEQKIQSIQTTVAGLANTTETQQKSVQALIDEINQLKQKAEQSASPNKDKWLAAEVRYLVRLADINLQFRQNVPQALTLLKLADQDIRDVIDPSFEELRKALAADIVDLQSVAPVDRTGIYMRLLALNSKVDQLPLMNKPAVAAESAQPRASTEELSWWRKGLQKSMDSLHSLVIVRYNASGKLPLVPPDQQAYLYQNWHTVLLHAMTALMQGETDIYRSSLQQAMVWVKEYSMTDTPIAKTFIEELNQLQSIDIQPATPKISRSLQAVDALTVS